MKRYKYNQYYFTSAQSLFNAGRKTGLGIYGSSTPDDHWKNDEVDKFAKELVPMPLTGANAYPVKYVFYREGKYIVGGTIACDSLIEMDDRTNVWTHVLEPITEDEQKSFEACLYMNDFQDVAEGKNKMVLPVCEKKVDDLEDLMTWEVEIKSKDLAAFLLKVLDVLDRKKQPLIFTDEKIGEMDFEAYLQLSEKVMRLIYHLTGGELRKRLNYITPMVHKCFLYQKECPHGARFYFGTEKEECEKIAVGQTLELNASEFQKSVLAEMMRLFKADYEKYEEIVNAFTIINEANYRKEEYLWHFVYSTYESENMLAWDKMTAKDYRDAMVFIGKDENRLKIFQKITRKLLTENKVMMGTENAIQTFCALLKRWNIEGNKELMQEMVEIIAVWFVMFPTLDTVRDSVFRKSAVPDTYADRIKNRSQIVKIYIDDISDDKKVCEYRKLILGTSSNMERAVVKTLEKRLNLKSRLSVDEIYEAISEDSEWRKNMKLLQSLDETTFCDQIEEMKQRIVPCFTNCKLLFTKSTVLKKIAKLWDNDGELELWNQASDKFADIIWAKLQKSEEIEEEIIETWDEEFVEMYRTMETEYRARKENYYHRKKPVITGITTIGGGNWGKRTPVFEETPGKEKSRRYRSDMNTNAEDITGEIGRLFFKSGGLAGLFFVIDRIYTALRGTGEMVTLVMLLTVILLGILIIGVYLTGKKKLRYTANIPLAAAGFGIWLSMLIIVRIVFSYVLALAFSALLIVLGAGICILQRKRGRRER